MKKINVISSGNCQAIYTKSFLQNSRANLYFNIFFDTLNWHYETFKMYGKEVVTSRKIAFYGDKDIFYSYSGNSKKANYWTDELLHLKIKVENELNISFNCCLLNLYHNGSEGMGWHSDNEPELGVNPLIASVSLGADRIFKFKHKITNQEQSVCLENGSLLVMKGEIQSLWKHSLPKSLKIKTPLINLTFRKIYL